MLFVDKKQAAAFEVLIHFLGSFNLNGSLFRKMVQKIHQKEVAICKLTNYLFKNQDFFDNTHNCLRKQHSSHLLSAQETRVQMAGIVFVWSQYDGGNIDKEHIFC